ncbi:MAG: type II toxin-antitoxin system prevent-host-death family antitoxin [candidate division Zixibacteria bacterium]|nr:type II toxin-antitoxin system prevent-host-death family antitoxin [candidate division Zixibacteria bacterium]
MTKKVKRKITKSVSALNARTHFGEILERAGSGQERFLIYRKGEPTAVILGIEDFLENITDDPEVFRKAHLKAKGAKLDQLTMDEIDREVTEVRRNTNE